MTRIDRYILVLYFRSLIVCFLSLSGLLIIVHVFSNLDEFIDYGNQTGNMVQGLLNYYGPYSLGIFDKLVGLMAMMAMMFVIAWLYRTNELTAILAAGVSKGRVVKPMLIATVAVFALGTINREIVLPRFANSLGKNPQDLGGKQQLTMRPMYDRDQYFLIGGKHLLVDDHQIVEPIFRLDGPASRIGKQITADTATYVAADSTHPGGYLLEGVRSPVDFATKDSVVDQGRTFLLLPKDQPWLKSTQCFIVSNVPFDLLEGGSAWKTYASTWSMIQRVRSDPRYYGADVRVAIHARIVRPFLDVALVLLGMPIVLLRQDRHLFWVAGAAISLVVLYMGLVIGVAALGSSGTFLSPWLAAWLPLVMLLPVGWTNSKLAMAS